MRKNERADQIAREAVKYSTISINTPPSWAAYKQVLKLQIYQEWEDRWVKDNYYRMNIFLSKIA